MRPQSVEPEALPRLSRRPGGGGDGGGASKNPFLSALATGAGRKAARRDVERSRFRWLSSSPKNELRASFSACRFACIGRKRGEGALGRDRLGTLTRRGRKVGGSGGHSNCPPLKPSTLRNFFQVAVPTWL